MSAVIAQGSFKFLEYNQTISTAGVKLSVTIPDNALVWYITSFIGIKMAANGTQLALWEYRKSSAGSFLPLSEVNGNPSVGNYLTSGNAPFPIQFGVGGVIQLTVITLGGASNINYLANLIYRQVL